MLYLNPTNSRRTRQTGCVKQALEKAVLAVESFIQEERDRKMSQEVATQEKAKQKPNLDVGALESVFIKGDISKMNEVQRIEYVREVCRSLGLNPLTMPFDYISFQGRIQLYAKKGCTDQLRSIYNLSVNIVSQTMEDGILTVTAKAKFPEGREDEDIGAVSVAGLKGEALCNAKMKAVTKAKRRVTLSICGLGMMDETETDSIPGAVKGERVFDSFPTNSGSWTPSEAQLKRLFAINRAANLTNEDLKEVIKKDYGLESTRELSRQQYDELCNRLQAKTTQPNEEVPAPTQSDDWDNDANEDVK